MPFTALRKRRTHRGVSCFNGVVGDFNRLGKPPKGRQSGVSDATAGLGAEKNEDGFPWRPPPRPLPPRGGDTDGSSGGGFDGSVAMGMGWSSQGPTPQLDWKMSESSFIFATKDSSITARVRRLDLINALRSRLASFLGRSMVSFGEM